MISAVDINITQKKQIIDINVAYPQLVYLLKLFSHAPNYLGMLHSCLHVWGDLALAPSSIDEKLHQLEQ